MEGSVRYAVKKRSNTQADLYCDRKSYTGMVRSCGDAGVRNARSKEN